MSVPALSKTMAVLLRFVSRVLFVFVISIYIIYFCISTLLYPLLFHITTSICSRHTGHFLSLVRSVATMPNPVLRINSFRHTGQYVFSYSWLNTFPRYTYFRPVSYTHLTLPTKRI